MRKRVRLGLVAGLVAAGGALAQDRPAPGESRQILFAHADERNARWTHLGQGRSAGMMPAIIDLVVVGGCGFKVAYVALSWQRARQAVMAGEADALFTIATPERAAYAEFTPSPVAVLTRAVIYDAGHPRAALLDAAQDLAALKDFRYVYNENSQTERERAAHFPVKTGVAVDERIFPMIAAGRGDFTIQAADGLPQLLKRLKLNHRIKFTVMPWLGKIEYRIGLRRDFPGGTAQAVACIETAAERSHRRGAVDKVLRGAGS